MKKWLLSAMLMLGVQQAHALCLPIACSCSVSATPVAFGSFNPLPGTVHNATGTVTVSCNALAGILVPYTIALSTGNGTYASRRMLSGTRNLYYNLYSDTNHTTIWGDGTGGSSLVSGSVTLAALSSFSIPVTVYGRIVAGQNTLVPGLYTDTITVTLTYQ